MMTKRKASISSILHEALEKRESEVGELLRNIEQDRAYISPKVPTKLTFNVTLHSHWANEGEKSVTICESIPLNKIIPLAIAEFKRVNNRSDVQANWYVWIIFPSGTKVILPKEHWGYLVP